MDAHYELLALHIPGVRSQQLVSSSASRHCQQSPGPHGVKARFSASSITLDLSVELFDTPWQQRCALAAQLLLSSCSRAKPPLDSARAAAAWPAGMPWTLHSPHCSSRRVGCGAAPAVCASRLRRRQLVGPPCGYHPSRLRTWPVPASALYSKDFLHGISNHTQDDPDCCKARS